MIHWGRLRDDGSIVPANDPCTATLTLAYQLTGDVSYATRAFQQARTKLMMARRVLRGGREHADMGGGVCSVAAGHGRNWGIGAVTGCYGQLSLGMREVTGRVTPSIDVAESDGTARIPKSVLSLVRPSTCGGGQAQFHNAGDEATEFAWRPSDAEEWRPARLQPGETTNVLL